MSEVAVKQARGATAQTQCRHHWLIESPNGPTSMGICRLCGAQKEFRNWAHSWLWEDDPLSELSRGRWGATRGVPYPGNGGTTEEGEARGSVISVTRLGAE